MSLLYEKRMTASYHSLTVEEVLKAVGSSLEGLTAQEAKKRLDEHGYNELKKEDGISALTVFLRQFTSWLVILLIIAGILSLFVGDLVDSIAIFIIVVLNALFGFFQEYKAEKAIEALQKLSEPYARVIRDGKEINLPTKELVVGDIILLEAGDIVPADSRLIEEFNLKIDEASLTGESVAVSKRIDALKANLPVFDRKNIVFMSTNVSYGKAKAVVISTGMNSEIGKIASTIEKTKETETPLQIKFKDMASEISIVFSVLVVLVFLLGFFFLHNSLREMFLFSLTLAVAVVPESLPAIVTISLGLGSMRLAKKNMLIRKLPAAESLGACTVICSDKTGTMTKNEMTAKKLFLDFKEIDVFGSGYEPRGSFSELGKAVDAAKYEDFFRIGCLCNNSKLNFSNGKYFILGDPTEGSLVVAAKKAGFSIDYFKKNSVFMQEFPFDSERKIMSVVYKNKKTGKKESLVKGAPDFLLKRCDRILLHGRVRKLTEEDKKEILKVNERFSSGALRVLGFAYKEIYSAKKISIDDAESDLIFVGLVGMIDPPREGVKEAVLDCEKAGIKVIMMTGDHALTARAIGEQIGLFKDGDVVLTGSDLDKITDSELAANINTIRIIARIMPIQKLRIVNALQKIGHVVAMTGDGVNDAPALKKADIGIAMGITGTDVSKQVSKAVLVDDNFTTIVNAIREGRNIYDKMIKSVRYLLSCNAGEVLAVFIAVILGFPLILLPLQILVMNLLTDNFPAMGLGFEESNKNIMSRKPRNPREKPINFRILMFIILFGAVMAVSVLLLFNHYQNVDLAKAQTVAFTTLVILEMFAVLSSRSLENSFSELNLFNNLWLVFGILLAVFIQLIVVYFAPLQAVFGTVALDLKDWGAILAVSLIGFVVMEISKFALNTFDKKKLSI